MTPERRAAREDEDLRAAIAELLAAGDFMATNPAGTITPGALARWYRAAAHFSEEP